MATVCNFLPSSKRFWDQICRIDAYEDTSINKLRKKESPSQQREKDRYPDQILSKRIGDLLNITRAAGNVESSYPQIPSLFPFPPTQRESLQRSSQPICLSQKNHLSSPLQTIPFMTPIINLSSRIKFFLLKFPELSQKTRVKSNRNSKCCLITWWLSKWYIIAKRWIWSKRRRISSRNTRVNLDHSRVRLFKFGVSIGGEKHEWWRFSHSLNSENGWVLCALFGWVMREGNEKRDLLSNSFLGTGKLIDFLSVLPFFLFFDWKD